MRLSPGGTLVVWKLSRLARSLTLVIKAASDIGVREITLKVLTQNSDTTTPAGRLFFHLTAAFDEPQRELIVENTRVGLKDTENYPFIGDISDQLKIGHTAFYKLFLTDRIKQLRAGHTDQLQN